MALGLRHAMPQCPSTPGPDSTALAKPTGAVCNLDCKSCFLLSIPLHESLQRLTTSRTLRDEAMTMLAHDASA